MSRTLKIVTHHGDFYKEETFDITGKTWHDGIRESLKASAYGYMVSYDRAYALSVELFHFGSAEFGWATITSSES